MTVSDDLWPEQRFFFRSDHFNFARREMPAIFFFTGVHEDYHRPDRHRRQDRPGQDHAHHAPDLPLRPRHRQRGATGWDPAGLEEVRRLTSQRR
jgi:hypothetical protein